MVRVVTYFLLLAALSPTCWAQATSSQASASPELKSVGIVSIGNRSASTVIPTLMSAQTPSSLVGTTSGLKRVGIMPVISRSSGATPKYNGITYNGGPIIDDANGVNVYYIWYGDWSKNKPAQTIMTDFIKQYGGSPNANINTTYYDYEVGPNGTQVVKDRVVNAIHYMGSTNDYYSHGVNLTDDDVFNIAFNAVADGRLPFDHNGVYFVLTSADVTETSGFCTYYCAWHGYAGNTAADAVIMAFVGNPQQCPLSCAVQDLTPNSNFAADTMVSSIAHELEESVTDPLGTSWINSDFSENEDMCVYTYGKSYTLPNGSFANMKLGKRQYLIQQNWVNAKGGYCAKSWDE
jgi:phosphate-induced protein 1